MKKYKTHKLLLATALTFGAFTTPIPYIMTPIHAEEVKQVTPDYMGKVTLKQSQYIYDGNEKTAEVVSVKAYKSEDTTKKAETYTAVSKLTDENKEGKYLVMEDGTTIDKQTDIYVYTPTVKGKLVVRTKDSETGKYIDTELGTFENAVEWIITTADTKPVGQLSIDESDVTLSNTLTYTGQEQTQEVIVKIGDKELTEGEDYTVTGNTATEAGIHSLTVTGIGAYTGVVTKQYTIIAPFVEKTSYTVNYVDENNNKLMDSKTVDDQEVGSTITESAVNVQGYTVKQASCSITLQSDASKNIINFIYTKDVQQKHCAKIQVQYFYGNTLAEAKAKTTADAVDDTKTVEGNLTEDVKVTVDVNKNKFTGYSYNSMDGDTEYTLKANVTDDTTHIVKVYYVVNQYAYTVKYVDVDTNKEIGQSTTSKVNYQTVVKASNNRKTFTNYKYVKDTGDLKVSENEGNNVITIYYKSNKTTNTGTDTNIPMYAGLTVSTLLGLIILSIVNAKKKLTK